MFLLKHERRRGGNISYAICGVPCSETTKEQKTKRAKSNKKLVLPRRRILKCALFSGTARTEAGL